MNENVEMIAVPKTLLVAMHNIVQLALRHIERIESEPSLLTAELAEGAERLTREAREYLEPNREA